MLYTYDKRSDSLLSAARSYVSDSIEAGDPVVLVLPTHYHQELKNSLPDFHDLERSRMLFLTASEHVYLEEGRFSCKVATEQWDWISRRNGSCSNTRLFGAGGSGITSDRYSILKLIEYESSVNRRFNAKMGVCAYDIAAVPDDLINEVVACHPFFWDGKTIEKNSDYMPPDSFYEKFYARDTHRFVWPAEPCNCREARIAVAELAARMPFDLDEIDAIVLAVGEAVTNAVRHGSPRRSENNVTVDVICSIDCIKVEITDEGCGLCHDPRPIDVINPGGRGLYIMRQLCDRVEHFAHDGGCTVRLTKYTTRSPL